MNHELQSALAVKKNNMSSSGDGDHVTLSHRFDHKTVEGNFTVFPQPRPHQTKSRLKPLYLDWSNLDYIIPEKLNSLKLIVRVCHTFVLFVKIAKKGDFATFVTPRPHQTRSRSVTTIQILVYPLVEDFFV